MTGENGNKMENGGQDDSFIVQEIERLKKEKDAVILAHYYVPGEVQDVADYVGDSFFLSRTAEKLKNRVIVFCGVSFMGESACVLNPEKKVLMPDLAADCPMAHMAAAAKVAEMRAKYDNLAVVCYINSTNELKAVSDVCITSSNALKVIGLLPQKNIFMIPDMNLGHYVAEQLPEKNFIFNKGYCPVHHGITEEELLSVCESHPQAKVLAHPECQGFILKHADYVGSTSGIIDYPEKSEAKEFIIVTEMGVLHRMEKLYPDREFYLANDRQICKDMKLNTLEKVLAVLENEENIVTVSEDMSEKAVKPLSRMLELSAL